MMREHEDDFAEALRLDLGKCRFEAVLTEMSFVAAEAKYARKHLAQVDAAEAGAHADHGAARPQLHVARAQGAWC